MDIYTYIAANNPQAVENILMEFGYEAMNVQSVEDLAQCLEDLVAKEGDTALTKIASIHPDRELIIEKFGTGKPSGKGDGCGCGWCKKGMKLLDKSKPLGEFTPSSAAQLLIISGTVLCTVALIMRS